MEVEEAKLQYFKHTRELLRDHPVELLAFEKHWEAGQLRQAYVCATEAVTRLGLSRTAIADKADEDFFWLWMH